MTTTGQRMTALLQDMVQDRQRYISLKNLLEEQRTLLLERNSEQLNRVNQELMQIYQLLADSATARQQSLQTLGFSADKAGLRQFIQRLPEQHQGKISALWEDLQRHAQLCQQLNERNGMVLHMQQQVMENVVNAGQPADWLY
ncbi:flagellar protein FlgN [Buttiauxella noackiae]|jgi:flagella synthesis protein FlgN|uniref:flagellar protein FlgN n=1 Tax=Buttiauxella noackiae TaxID=82992 RepID=UPI000556A42E|nr:flagellar protein FlgN [Buttiauxella noackiae]